MIGFTFDGRHSSEFGCYYIPPAQSRGGDMEDYSITSQEIDGRDGGYYIGNSVGIREIQLECYLEEVDAGTRERLLNWLMRGTPKKLTIDTRPYVQYDAVPCKRIVISQYKQLAPDGTLQFSGTFTATFKIHDPFGKLTLVSKEIGDAGDYPGMGILPRSMMPPVPTLTAKSFLVYCPGTERANTLIRLSGDVGDGLIIRNATTGQCCRIAGLRANSLPPGSYLSLDSAKGQVLVHKGDDTELAFHFHDLGYVQLAPCLPMADNVEIVHTAGQREIRSNGAFRPVMAGQYVYLSGWKKIHRIESADIAHLMVNAETTDVSKAPIVTMNELYLDGDEINLARFELEYVPRTR